MSFIRITDCAFSPGWRVFDDFNVDNIDERSIVTNNAYILFYRLNEQPTGGSMETSE